MARFSVLLVLFSVAGCRTSGKWPALAWGRNKQPAYSTASSAPTTANPYTGLPSAAGGAEANYTGAPASPYGQSPYGQYAETPTSYDGPSSNAAIAQDGYSGAPGYGAGGAGSHPSQTARAGGAGTQTGPYDATYPGQEEQPASYTAGTVTNPYAAGQARDYGDYRSPTSSGSLGQDPVRMADARGAAATRNDATSRYDTTTPYNGATQYPADGTSGQELDRYPPTGATRTTDNRYPSDTTSPIHAPSIGSDYRPGQSDYQPGATGYSPPGVRPYQGAGGSAGAAGVEPRYRPAGTRDYLPADSGGSTAPWNQGSGQKSQPASPTGSVYAETIDERSSSISNDRYPDYRDASAPLAPPEVNVALPPR